MRRPVNCDGASCGPESGRWVHEAPCTALVIEEAADHMETPAGLDGIPAGYWLGRAPQSRPQRFAA